MIIGDGGWKNRSGSGGGSLENPKRFVGDEGIYAPNGAGSGVCGLFLLSKGNSLSESLCKASSSGSFSDSCSCCSNSSSASRKGWLPKDPELPVLGPGLLCSRGSRSPELPLLDDVRAPKVPRLCAVVSDFKVALSSTVSDRGSWFRGSRFLGSRGLSRLLGRERLDLGELVLLLGLQATSYQR